MKWIQRWANYYWWKWFPKPQIITGEECDCEDCYRGKRNRRYAGEAIFCLMAIATMVLLIKLMPDEPPPREYFPPAQPAEPLLSTLFQENEPILAYRMKDEGNVVYYFREHEIPADRR